jgi:hypothetical protein
MLASGIAPDASVSGSLGRAQGSPVPRISAFPAAEVNSRPDAEFVLRQEIGRGGMATVWAAAQTALGREVALKRASDPDDKTAELLLLREATVAGQLEHPNIVPIHQLVVDAQGPAVVMKKISGKTWDELIEDHRVTLESHLEILLQTLNAVDFAHSRGVLHRDIKPENVMVGDFGEVYLLDWGVAKRADDPRSSAIVGTPCYMAPEMADGFADERTDVFLLGATLHEVLTGEPRHEGDDALSVLYAAVYVEPYAYSSSVPSELGEICNTACARVPEQRFPSVRALRDAILRFREHRAANALTDGAYEVLARLTRASAASSATSAGYSEVQRLFGETRFGFEAALRIWSESPAARAGLTRTLRCMIDYELSLRHVEAAEALLALLMEPDAERAQQIQSLADELERERQHVRSIERDRDPSVGALGRTRAYLAMGGVTGLMTLVLVVRRMWLPDQGTSTLRLTLVGALVLALMLGVALLWRRFGTFNQINRRILEISIGALAVSFASRLSGYITGCSPERVLTTDAFILALGGLALAPYHAAGPWLAGTSFCVAAVGSLYPSLVDDLFIGLSLFVPVAMLLWNRKELRVRVTPSAAQPDFEGL